MKKKNGLDALLKCYEDLMPETAYLAKVPKRYDDVKQAIQDISDFVWQNDGAAKINITADGLTGTSVCMEIISNLIVIDHVEKFCNALRTADNFEAYAKTDGTVAFGIVFEGVFDAVQPKSTK